MEQSFINAEEARKLTEERRIILRKERKDNIMAAIVENAEKYGRFQVGVTTELYWDDELLLFFKQLGYEIEVHPELIVIKWGVRRSI